MNIGMVKKSRLSFFVCFFAFLAAASVTSPASATVTLTIGADAISPDTIASPGNLTTVIGPGGHTWDGSTLYIEGAASISSGFPLPVVFTGSGPVTIEISGYVGVSVNAEAAISSGNGVNLHIKGKNGKANDHLSLVSSGNDGLSVDGNLTIENIDLSASGNYSGTTGPNTAGYAGIRATGSIDIINNAMVYARGDSEISDQSNFPADSGPAFGIFAKQDINIKSGSDVSVEARQYGAPYGGRAVGIFSKNGDIDINGAFEVSVSVTSTSASAAGIYSERGDVKIASVWLSGGDGGVLVSALSQSSVANEHRGFGIAAGKNVVIDNALVVAGASAKLASGVSAGIAASVPSPNNSNPSGKVEIKNGSDVRAGNNSGTFGSEEHGIVIANGGGSVDVTSTAHMEAIGHGAGYAIKADAINNAGGTVALFADNGNYYPSNATVTGTITTKPFDLYDELPKGGGGIGGGGCDAGFGGIAALFALCMLRVMREKRA